MPVYAWNWTVGSTTIPTTFVLTQRLIGHYCSVAECPALPGGQEGLAGQGWSGLGRCKNEKQSVSEDRG